MFPFIIWKNKITNLETETVIKTRKSEEKVNLMIEHRKAEI